MMVSRNYKNLVYSGLVAVFFLLSGAGTDAQYDRRGFWVDSQWWVDALHAWTRNESERFVRVNPECEHLVESVYEILWPVVDRIIYENRLEQAVRSYSYNPFNELLPEIDAVFREAFGILKGEGKFAAGEVEKYLSDLDASAGIAARYTDLCGVYLLLQVVPITKFQSDKIIHEQLFSNNGRMTSTRSTGPFSGFFSYSFMSRELFISPIIELLGPHQRKHIEYALTQAERFLMRRDNRQIGYIGSSNSLGMLPKFMEALLAEVEMPEEERFFTSFMQSYYKTAASLLQREYHLDPASAKKLEMAGLENIALAINYYEGFDRFAVHEMGSCGDLIRQMPAWQKMIAKISEENLQSAAIMEDNQKYIMILQELDLYQVLKDISRYPRQRDRAVENDRLTGAQIESLIDNLGPHVRQDRFQRLMVDYMPDSFYFLRKRYPRNSKLRRFILNEKRDELANVLNESQI